jgi:hypothetical protein
LKIWMSGMAGAAEKGAQECRQIVRRGAFVQEHRFDQHALGDARIVR